MTKLASKRRCSATVCKGRLKFGAAGSIKFGQRLLFLALTLILVSGCSRFDTDYGASKGASGNKSLNGFGALRTVLQSSPEDAADTPQVELRARDMVRLSERELRNDAIVWIPSEWSPMNLPEIESWMGRWLDQGGRTLVFIVPDEGSTEAYFQETIDIAPPAQRLAYRRRLAKQINDRLLTDSNREDVRVKNWFIAKALPYRTHLPQRRLADYEIKPASPKHLDPHVASDTDLTITAELPAEAWDDDEFDDEQRGDEELAGEQWDAGDTEITEAEATPATDRRTRRLDPLIDELATIAGRPTTLTTLARFTDDRWPHSQVLIVASGSLLTNFAMTKTPAQEMATRIRSEIRQTSDAGEDEGISVAFLSTDDMPVLISTSTPGAPNTKGWELMTQMPLSLINMHVAFLGIVLCLMLLPVFGRPRHVRYNRATHFGNHLSAMATLMRRSGGVAYAHTKISQYLRQVRGETSGPWVLPEEAQDSKT